MTWGPLGASAKVPCHPTVSCAWAWKGSLLTEALEGCRSCGSLDPTFSETLRQRHQADPSILGACATGLQVSKRLFKLADLGSLVTKSQITCVCSLHDVCEVPTPKGSVSRLYLYLSSPVQPALDALLPVTLQTAARIVAQLLSTIPLHITDAQETSMHNLTTVFFCLV